MKKIILASHGELSKGMINSIQMIVGTPSSCELNSYSLYPGQNAADFAKEIEEEARNHPEDQYIVIADIKGGSVHTALIQAMKTDNIVLFSGMNMNLVLEIVLSGENEMNPERFIQAGQEGITFMNKNSVVTQEEEDF